MTRVLMFLLASAFSIGCSETINPGEVGVGVDWGETQPWIYPEGYHFTSMWMNVIHMSTRTQAYEMGTSGTTTSQDGAPESTIARGDAIHVLSHDQLEVILSATVQFHLNATTAPQIYRYYGESYADTIVHPIVRTAIRDAASTFTAIELVDERPRLQTMMENLVHSRLEEALSSRNVPTNAVVVENILLQGTDLPDSLDAAIAAVQNQRQETVRAQQALLTAQAEANRVQTEANGHATAQRIVADTAAYTTRAEADATAYANQTISASMTPSVLEYRRIEALSSVLQSTGTRTMFVPNSGFGVMMSDH